MVSKIQIRNKHVFGLITSGAFHDYPWNRLNDDGLIIPLLKCIKVAVQDKIDKSIEYVILTLEYNNAINGYSLLFYAKLILGVTKGGDPARIKRALDPDSMPFSPVDLPFPISIRWISNPYGSNSNPLKAHIDKINELNLPASKWENFEVDHTWQESQVQADVMDDILSCSTTDDAKDLIRSSLDSEEIASTGMKQIKAFKEFQKQKSGPKPFDPPGFCCWGLDKLKDLTPHSEEHQIPDRKCFKCREKRVWEILKAWWDDVFMKQKKKGKIKLNDGSMIEEVFRKRFLIIRGDRKTGKTQWVKNLVNRKMEHIAWIKHRLSRDNTGTIGPDTWLIVLDDFSWDRHDREMMKSITSAEYTELDGKWLSKSLPPGIPCIILCNDKEDVFYKALKKDKDFAKEGIFVNLKEDIFIAPADVDNSELDYKGPKSTLDSDDEEVNAPSDAYTIIMRQDGNPSHVAWEEYQNLRKLFEKQAKEMNEIKRAFNTAQQQMKELRRGKQLYFPSKDDEEEDWNQNPRKQVKKDSPQSDNGSKGASTISKPTASSACKSLSRAGSREYDVPPFSIE